MTDEGKEAGLRPGGPHAGAKPDPALDTGPDTPPDPAAGKGASSARRAQSRGSLSDHTRSRLSLQLRTMYDSVVQQPVPDRFAELIAQLDGTPTPKKA